MARHASNYHLELAQLWRCPVSWCTIWKGTPQVAWTTSVRTANLVKWFPPWTVTRQTWNDTLNPRISGVSTDVLLLSECGHALVHHYRVFTKGISHVSLGGSYLDNLRRSLRSPRLWAGVDRTKIRHSHHPYMTARLPRGASDSGTQMMIHPAARLAGRAHPI